MIEDRLLKMNEVLTFLPFGRTKFNTLMKEIELLHPIKVGGTNVWKNSSIQEYIKTLN